MGRWGEMWAFILWDFFFISTLVTILQFLTLKANLDNRTLIYTDP